MVKRFLSACLSLLIVLGMSSTTLFAGERTEFNLLPDINISINDNFQLIVVNGSHSVDGFIDLGHISELVSNPGFNRQQIYANGLLFNVSLANAVVVSIDSDQPQSAANGPGSSIPGSRTIRYNATGDIPQTAYHTAISNGGFYGGTLLLSSLIAIRDSSFNLIAWDAFYSGTLFILDRLHAGKEY